MALFNPPILSEQQLVVALQRGDARAQKAAYDRLAGKMMAVCVRYVANHDDAEEVLIDGFMRVFDRVNQFRGEGSFEGWVRRIMVTESLMFLRKNKSLRQQLPLNELTNTPECTLADQTLETEDLLRLVALLPDGYRSVFNLYAIEGYSHAEIAALTGISEGTSKSQLSRARAWLQQKINRTDLIGQPASIYGKTTH